VGAHHRALQEAPRLKLSIVVPAFNEERLLPGTLQSIRVAAAALEGWAWELVVCDNNSTDRTAEIARAAGAQVVFEPHNQISRARNRGAQAAQGEWLLFIDADSSPGAGLFAELRKSIESGKVLAGGSTVAAVGSPGFRLAIRGWNAISRLTRWAAGSFIFCKSDAFSSLGGFSEELYASEELELFVRLKRLARARGKRIVILHRHPLVTSDRKLRLYGWRELFGVFGRFLLHPHKSLRNAAACSPWYDGRR
jgi:glycosyltransferase involved in cell wall biosynthesis